MLRVIQLIIQFILYVVLITSQRNVSSPGLSIRLSLCANLSALNQFYCQRDKKFFYVQVARSDAKVP